MELATILQRHQIESYNLKKDLTMGNESFKSEQSFVVPLNQHQYRLIRAIFEQRTAFQDSLFYDVSGWTFPLAFGIDWASLDSKSYSNDLLGERFDFNKKRKSKEQLKQSDYAYAFPWNDYFAPKVLFKIQNLGLRTKVAIGRLTTREDFQLGYGTVLIPVQNQNLNSDSIFQIVNRINQESSVTFHSLASGYSGKGIDLGSPRFKSLDKPAVAVLVGQGVSAYESGEVWHLLDWRLDIPVTLIPLHLIEKSDLDKFTTMVIVDGDYGGISSSSRKKIEDWTKSGGVLIGWKKGAKWLSDNQISHTKIKKLEMDSTSQRKYSELDQYQGAQKIGGSIFATSLDLSHPLGFGYSKAQVPVFLNSRVFFERPSNSYAYPVVFENNPLISGYISDDNLAHISDSPVVVVSKYGEGRVISFAINPNFRAIWYGTNKLFLNSIFFGAIIDSKSGQ